MVLTGQETHNTPNQRGTGEHLYPAGGPLQAAPSGGRGDTDNSATGDDRGRNPIRGRVCSGSAEATNREGGRSIRYEGRASEGLSKGGDTGKGPRHKTVGQTGEYDEAGVPRGVHPDRTDMDDDVDNT